MPSKTALWRKKASFGTHFVIMSAGLSQEAMARRMMVRQATPHRTIAYRVAIHRDEDLTFSHAAPCSTERESVYSGVGFVWSMPHDISLSRVRRARMHLYATTTIRSSVAAGESSPVRMVSPATQEPHLPTIVPPCLHSYCLQPHSHVRHQHIPEEGRLWMHQAVE